MPARVGLMRMGQVSDNVGRSVQKQIKRSYTIERLQPTSLEYSCQKSRIADFILFGANLHHKQYTPATAMAVITLYSDSEYSYSSQVDSKREHNAW